MPSSLTRYDTIAMCLHWLMAFLMLGLIVLGFYMDTLPSRWQGLAYGLHKATGIMVLFLAMFRLIWRMLNPPPAMPTSIPAYQRIAAHMGHWALYLLMLGFPLTGWLFSSAAAKRPIDFYGLGTIPFLPMPAETALRKAIGSNAHELHLIFANVAILLIGLHVAAALLHQFYHKIPLLQRMLPARRA